MNIILTLIKGKNRFDSEINTKRKSAYSLLEIIISLAIVGIAMTIMINFLLLSLQISASSLARSNVREEISTINNLISRDIRNAKKITSCSGNTCNILTDQGDNIQWTWDSVSAVVSKVVMTTDLITGLPINTNIYSSSTNIKITSLDFSSGYVSNISKEDQNILITTIGAYAVQNLKIKNIIKQTSVSTRNLDIIK